MSKTVPVFVSVSAADPRSITRQISDGIRMAIASGTLPVGAQLPSVRGLAQQLTINPKTVAKAYDELAADGWLDARQGLGLFVAAPPATPLQTRARPPARRRARGLQRRGCRPGFPLEHIVDRVSAKLTPLLDKRSA